MTDETLEHGAPRDLDADIAILEAILEASAHYYSGSNYAAALMHVIGELRKARNPPWAYRVWCKGKTDHFRAEAEQARTMVPGSYCVRPLWAQMMLQACDLMDVLRKEVGND